MMTENKDVFQSFISGILNWGDLNRRDFPWRHSKDPYRIMIAEILLQRTKAKQVLPVYLRFTNKYPVISTLAEASEQEIFELIKPLGLAKRAEGIKRLSQQIVEEYGAEIPKDRTQLLKIHWIGRYIADAIMCHAYGINVPTYDVNFARLIDRVFLLRLKKPRRKDPKGYAFAASLIPYADDRFKELNLSIIDFSDAICKSRKPLCAQCPIKSICNYVAL